MSNPLVEQIALKLVDYINAITVANGFNYDLTAVRPKRLHLEGDINADNTVLIEQESASRRDIAAETISWRQAFTLQAIVIDSDRATEPIDTRLNKIRSDIERKLLDAACRTCGGLAEGIMLRDPEKFIMEPQLAGIAVNIDVLYQTAYDDPYTAV